MVKLAKFFKAVIRDTFKTSLILFRILIPVSIVIKILQELDQIKYIGQFLNPVMKFVGLPGDYGIVWATAIITNIYGGAVAFFSIFPGLPLTTAQITVLCTMILIAHAFPVELAIIKKAGVRIKTVFLIRILGAVFLGWTLNTVYSLFNLYQQPGRLIWLPKVNNSSLPGWIMGELKNYLIIFCIIGIMSMVLKLLRETKFVDKITAMLNPFLVVIGIGRQAAPITLIGIIMGISYGGGLILKEIKSELLTKRDVFFSLVFMAICHSLIEDTLLMVSLGASLSGVLLARVIFSFSFIALFVLFTKKFPKCFFGTK